MKSFEDIQKIYCINLPHRIDRKNDCIKIFNEIGLSNVSFVKAHNGSKLFPDKNKKVASRIGCTLSHIDVIKKISLENIKYTIILEDDFICDNDFISKFNNYCDQIPEDFCIMYLGANHRVPPIKYSKNIVKCEKSFCAHAYIINKEYADKILQGDIFSYPVIDVYYSNFIQKTYPCYCFNPKIIWQRKSYSDIENKIVDYPSLK